MLANNRRNNIRFICYYGLGISVVSTAKCPARDNTLLTVGFNLRIEDAACHVSTKSRRDFALNKLYLHFIVDMTLICLLTLPTVLKTLQE